MSDNKFIKRLKGEQTDKSVLEIKNESAKTSFANMPQGTSNAVDVYSDHRGNATGVLKGTENWKLDGQNLIETTTVYGDGRDFTDSFNVFGNGLWVNATCTFATARRFSPNTKFVLKLCGHDLETVIGNTVDFTLIVKFGTSNLISKTFTVTEQAFNFCKEFVIDFAESNSSTIKADAGSTMQVQLLCANADAQAVIYNGMTVFTALQRRVDGDAVASDKKTFDEVVDDVEQIQEDLDDLEEYVDDTFVRLDGGSIMTGPLKFEAGSMRGAVSGYLNGVAFWKMSAQHAITNIANLTDSQFLPVITNSIDIGRSANKWKDLYLSGNAYVATLNNGADLTVPNKTGILATMADVELAARSGRMLTDQGVWYAKMYSATVPPAAENGTNYADFSQVDGDNNPIIVIYERQSGAWVQTDTITPPADYDGYVPITSKIWDIAEQSGQQGGRILWNHVSKEFTPYPTIVSFEDIEITGTSTVIMPYNPSANQIVNKDYVDTLVSNSIGDATITLTQGGQTMGSFTTNQSGDATIALDGGSSYHPDMFDWKWADHQLNDVQWLRADTFSWQSGSVYEAAYNHLVDDIDALNVAAWSVSIINVGMWARYPDADQVGQAHPYAFRTRISNFTYEYVYSDVENPAVNTDYLYDGYTSGASSIGYPNNAYSDTVLFPFFETIAGTTITYHPATDGHKIVLADQESNVAAIYTATGVAWYYIIDTENEQFKLPRTKFGVTGLRDTVGNYVEPGLPNITGHIPTPILSAYGTTGGAFYSDGNSNTGLGTGSHSSYGINFNASRSSAVYGNGTTVQPPATQMYLYFYVGEFTQTAIENTAGLNAELFNDKLDNTVSHVVQTYTNGTSWYRLYSDGWCEQGGLATLGTGGTGTVNFLKPFINTDYYFGCDVGRRADSSTWIIYPISTYSTTSQGLKSNLTGYTLYSRWRACGYVS